MEASNEERIGSAGGGSKSSFLCRQSSTRWIPTSDQIRILRDLYYNSGLRSPSAEQIQRISAKLRQYGKIEGKNVFYWFQNHKARERQKKRLTVDLPGPNSTTKYPTNTMSPGVPPACSSQGLYGAGQMGSSGFGVTGSALMERSFRESFVYGGGDGAAMENNMGWMPPPYHYYMGEQEAEQRPVETLPLFPTSTQEEEEEEEEQHTEQYSNGCYLPAFYWPAGLHKEEDHHYLYNAHHHHHGGAGASLELSLNSYHCAPPGSA